MLLLVLLLVLRLLSERKRWIHPTVVVPLLLLPGPRPLAERIHRVATVAGPVLLLLRKPRHAFKFRVVGLDSEP